MRILMVGLGSIGQRHVRNIRRLFGDEVEVCAFRVRKLQQTFSDTMQIIEGIDVEKQYNIYCYDDYETALGDNPDVVFITNVTSRHMDYAIKAAEAGCDLFIEKPLSDSMDSVYRLDAIVHQNGNIVCLGYQNRFNPCIKKLKEILNNKILGKIISVETCFGERVTTMHRYEDYRQTYMARKDLGGGCLLNLQIHDIDYLQWIFGMPKEVNGFLGFGSALGTDVEENAVLQYNADGLGYDIMITSRSDFFQYPPVHSCIVVGENGRVEIDLNSASMQMYVDDEDVVVYVYPDFQRNDMFIEELKVFMDCIKKREVPESSLADGINGLKIVEAAKKSAEENRIYEL